MGKVFIGTPITTISGGTTTTYNVTASNIGTYFTVTNGSYYFVGSGSTFTTNNAGVASSTATTTLIAKQACTISFDYSYSSESKYDLFTLKVAGTIVENEVSGATTSKSYSGSFSVGDTIEFTYAKDSSANANDDACTFSNMKISVITGGTASTKNNLAANAKKIYVGVDGVARKVKKAYIGVNNVARLFWADLELKATYDGYANFSSLTSAETDFSVGTIGNYSVIAGGCDDSNDDACLSTVAYIDATTLTTGTASALYTAVCGASPCSMPGLLIFGGGVDNIAGSSSTSTNRGNAYNTSLTRSTFTFTSDFGYVHGAYVQSGSTYYALFPVSPFMDISPASTPVNAISSTLTRSTLSSLSYGAHQTPTSQSATKVFIGGGQGDVTASRTQLNMYNSSLVKTSLTSPEQFSLAAANGKVALFNVDNTTAYLVNDSGVISTFVGDTSITPGDYQSNNPSFIYNGFVVFFNAANDQFIAYDENLVKSTCVADSLYGKSYDITCVGNRVFQYRSGSTSVRARYYTMSM